MTTLYELSDKILTALDIFSDMDECSEAEKAEAQVIITQLTESFNDKAVSVAMFIRNLEVEAEAIAEAKKSMDAREKALKTKAVRLKSYLLGEMKRTETKQIKCPYFVLSVRKNPVSVVIAPNAVIDTDLLLPPKPQEPDKRAIKAAIESGRVVFGCSLESSESLTIK